MWREISKYSLNMHQLQKHDVQVSMDILLRACYSLLCMQSILLHAEDTINIPQTFNLTIFHCDEVTSTRMRKGKKCNCNLFLQVSRLPRIPVGARNLLTRRSWDACWRATCPADHSALEDPAPPFAHWNLGFSMLTWAVCCFGRQSPMQHQHACCKSTLHLHIGNACNVLPARLDKLQHVDNCL